MIPTISTFSRACAALLCCAFATVVESAVAVDATFVLDQQQSSLTIDASTVVFITFSDSDTQKLGGTINASLDFGISGAFPTSAAILANAAAISPLNPFSLTLGSPPLGVNVHVGGAVADITTPHPPATLTRVAEEQVKYEFDAAEFAITLNQGNVVSSGASNQVFDLSTTPVSGTAQTGTLGTLTLTQTGVAGFFTQIDALLELPMMFTKVIDVGGRLVTLEVAGEVFASSSFQLARSRLSADFDGDSDVDAIDLAQWEIHFGGPGADSNGDGDSDGADFLAWQQQFRLGVAAPAAARAVPEPRAVALLSLAMFAAGASRGNDGSNRTNVAKVA